VKSAGFEVRLSVAASEDLLRLFDHLLDAAKSVEELEVAQEAINAIKSVAEHRLARSPFIYRKTGDSPFLRELIVPFRNTGYVVMYEIEGKDIVNILAVRHQLEDDYH
jgi:plasmid stabilization system protein ParE